MKFKYGAPLKRKLETPAGSSTGGFKMIPTIDLDVSSDDWDSEDDFIVPDDFPVGYYSDDYTPPTKKTIRLHPNRPTGPISNTAGTAKQRISHASASHPFVKQENSTFLEQLNESIASCRAEINDLEKNRSTGEEQREALIQVATEFQEAVRRAVLAQYNTQLPSMETELRETILAQNNKFITEMQQRGHQYDFKGKADICQWLTFAQATAARPGGTRSGLFDPGVATSPFRDQSSGWERIAREHITKVHTAVTTFLDRLLRTQPIDPSLRSNIATFLRPINKNTLDYAQHELSKILADERGDVLISCDPELDNILDDIRTDRVLREIAATPIAEQRVLAEKTQKLIRRPHKSEEEVETKELCTYIKTYYFTARVRFIDNVSLQVIERHFLALRAGTLVTAFSPATVAGLSEAEVERIMGTARDERAGSKRKRVEERLQRLEEVKLVG